MSVCIIRKYRGTFFLFAILLWLVVVKVLCYNNVFNTARILLSTNGKVGSFGLSKTRVTNNHSPILAA